MATTESRTMPHRYCLVCEEPTRIDRETGTGIDWHDDAGNTVVPPAQGSSEEAKLNAMRGGRHAVCAAAGHPLPDPDSILVGYFGQVWAGKDSMIGSALLSAGRGALMSHDVRLTPVETSDADRWAELAAAWVREGRWKYEPTATSEGRKYVPTELRAHVSGERSAAGRSIMLFNTSGEDFARGSASGTGLVPSGAESSFRRRFPFLPELDVIVIAVPPGCLRIPGARAPLAAEAAHSGRLTATGIDKMAAFLRDADSVRADGAERARRRIVVLALTKSDRYADVPGFPTRVLRPRPDARSVRDEFADEQPLLARFLIEHDGSGILQAATGISDTAYLCAVSGTGPDDPQGSVVAAPAHLADAARSLDPLQLAFLRYGVGQYD